LQSLFNPLSKLLPITNIAEPVFASDEGIDHTGLDLRAIKTVPIGTLFTLAKATSIPSQPCPEDRMKAHLGVNH
jgi:hypothetical protein